MKCMRCNKDFVEKEIEESHDVPLYLFEGNKRNERKNQADKFGRKWLCKKCHDKYEAQILKILFKNLLRKDIPLVLDRMERIPYFPKIWRLPLEKRVFGIKICLKLNEVDNDTK